MTDSNNNIILSPEEFDKQLTEGYEKNAETEVLVAENRQISARIQHQKLKMQEREINRIKKIEEALDDEELDERTFDRSRMLKEIEDRKNAVTFLNPKISKHFIAAPSSLIVIPSMTNNGKSTLTAHLAEALVNDGKRVLILSNEEKEEDVRARISCLRTKVSFGDYKSNKCTNEEVEIVLDDAEYLAKHKLLTVISSKNEVDAYMVTTVKGVMTTLEKAKNKFDTVLLDYYGNVNMSEFGAIEPWHVNNRLASELNIFKDTCPYPIVVFAQCEGIRSDKKVEDKGALDFESNHPMYRWKGGKSILLYATDIIELTKDFDNSCSILFAHKVRFSHGELERSHMLPFDKQKQRFVDWSADYDAKRIKDKTKKESSQRTKDVLKNIVKI
jgi:hypothetical protein